LDAVKFGLPLYQPSNWLGMPGFLQQSKKWLAGSKIQNETGMA